MWGSVVIFRKEKGSASIKVRKRCSRDVDGLWLHCINGLETGAPALQTRQYARYQPISFIRYDIVTIKGTEDFFLWGQAAAFLRLVYLTNASLTVHCTKSKITIVLFPRLVYLAKVYSPVHLSNVCQVIVIAFSRVVCLVTEGSTDRYWLSKHVVCLLVKYKLVGMQ